MNTIVQKLKKEEIDVFAVANRYYNILSAINDLHLTERELQLISFCSIKGNISYKHLREEFCEKYKTSSPTINNMIGKLKKSKILIKDGGKVKTNPIIILDFSSPISLHIQINGQTKES